LDSSTPCSSESVSTENPNEENVWNCNTPLLVKNILLQTICFLHFFFFYLKTNNFILCCYLRNPISLIRGRCRMYL
jgi:hypothetical protein